MENLTIPVTGKISTSNSAAPLSFKILLDDTIVYENSHVTDSTTFAFDLTDDDKNHKLQFVMSGKTQEHTVVDDQGNIRQDAMLTLSDLFVDEIDVTQLLTEHAVYIHDFNGTQNKIQDKFFGDLGCNGSVVLEFSTPFYLWLLENM